MLYRMAMLLMTLVPITPPQTTPIFAFFVAFHIFVVSKHRYFVFDVHVDRS